MIILPSRDFMSHLSCVMPRPQYGSAPLHEACFAGSAGALELLLEHKADAHDKTGVSPFISVPFLVCR